MATIITATVNPSWVMTYDSLTSTVLQYLERSDAAVVAAIPTFITGNQNFGTTPSGYGQHESKQSNFGQASALEKNCIHDGQYWNYNPTSLVAQV
jgi:hypothetical protein